MGAILNYYLENVRHFDQAFRNELLPVWREIGMGFFLYEWRSHEYRKKNFLTNHEWLSRRDEIKIPHARRSRKWGIFILSQLLSHDVMSEEIYPSLFLSRPGVTFPFLRGKFQHRSLHVGKGTYRWL